MAIRQAAISELDGRLDSLTKVKLAHECAIQEWFLPAIAALVVRKELLSKREVEELGVEFAFKVLQVRESAMMGGSDRGFLSEGTMKIAVGLGRVTTEHHVLQRPLRSC